MGIRDHIGIKLSALALTGGTAAMLFGATPVQTQFSATQNGTFSASGARVGETVANTITATELYPGSAPYCDQASVGGTVPISSTPGTLDSCLSLYNYSSPANFDFKNMGSVPEDFTITITGATGAGLVSWAQLAQLEFKVSLPGGGAYVSLDPFTSSGYSRLTSSMIVGTPHTIATNIAPGGTYSGTIAVALAPTPSSVVKGDGWGANDWKDVQNVKIDYAITATPSSPAKDPTLTTTTNTAY